MAEVKREVLEELCEAELAFVDARSKDDSLRLCRARDAYRAAKAAAEPKLRTLRTRAEVDAEIAKFVRGCQRHDGKIVDNGLLGIARELCRLVREPTGPDPAPEPMRWRTGTKNPHTLYRDDEPAGFLLRPEHAAELLRAPEPDEPTVTWRGSVTDMATDLKAIISPRKIAKLAAELAPSAAPARCSGDR